jgi:vacuolar-type H+-ATPase subunit I/STV1
MENNNSKGLAIGLAIAALLFLGLGIYFYIHGNSVKDTLTSEKIQLQSDLEIMNTKYDSALAENTSMTSALRAAQAEVASLQDSLSSVKADNQEQMNYFKNRVWNLTQTNDKLMQKVDSLMHVNDTLTVDLENAEDIIVSKTLEIEELSVLASDLAEKVALGSVLKVIAIDVDPVRTVSSGELLKSTNRFKKVEAFRVSIDIDENLIAEQGTRMVYFTVKDASGNIVRSNGEFELNGELISYTNMMELDYRNEQVNAVILLYVNKGVLSKGIYTIDVYLEGSRAATQDVELKSAVLGIF